MEPISEDDENIPDAPGFKNLLGQMSMTGSVDKNNGDIFDLNLEGSDVESEDEYVEPLFGRTSVSTAKTTSSQTIRMQPEMKLLMMEREREQEKATQSRDKSHRRASYTDDQNSLLRRFPWLAEKLKVAWDDLKEDPKKGTGKLRSGLKQATRFSTTQSSGILKSRNNKPTSLLKNNKEKSNETKVVFSRNIPILMYNKDNKKCIRLGGDRPNEKASFEEIYRAVHFNPELKKVTLDLEDLRFPEKERTLRLALSYISANTLHNPYVLSDDMCKFSYKKEIMIKLIVEEIERRLHRQRNRRDERHERQRIQDEEIQKQKEEEELRGRDFITAKRLLEKSKDVDPNILTDFEKREERKRRIRLRTKSIPTNERADVQVRQRRKGVPIISLDKRPDS